MNISVVNCSVYRSNIGSQYAPRYGYKFYQTGGSYDLTQSYVDSARFIFDSSRNRYFLSVNYAYIGGPYAPYGSGTANLYEDSNGNYSTPGYATPTQENDVITVEFKKLRESWAMENVITDVQLVMDGNTPTLSFTRETVTMELQ